MIWILIMLAIWVGAGIVLLMRGSPKSGGDYQREVPKRIYTIGETIPVSLKLMPPQRALFAADHDLILAIDHSTSMGSGPGSPLRESIRAAENFIRQLPESVYVGVVGFDQDARLLCPISPDHEQSLRTLNAIAPGGGTSIHLALDRCREALREGRGSAKKSLILLSDGISDQESAEQAVKRLHEEVPDTAVICIGFGAATNQTLMRVVASSPSQYIHIRNTDDLYSLFSLLAATVDGQLAAAGLVDEATWVPDYFHLARTTGLYPIGVYQDSPMRITWAVPLMSEGPPQLTYELTARCPGWHAISSPISKAVWRMADGTEKTQSGPAGPKVLILPSWLRWAWPLANPLFWMIFGRWWPCPEVEKSIEREPEAKPLPIPSLPTLLPAPQERPYQLDFRPALIVGLGEIGEWTVCRLKNRLLDRGIDPSQAEVVVVRITHRSNRPSVSVRGTTISADEYVELHQDLRPYLESLRDHSSPPMRAWVPWRRWLADLRPLTTTRTVADDRRKARLALLRKPDLVEQKLQPSLERIARSNNGLIVLVGSAYDAECSGTLAEVAHICAVNHVGVTAVLTPMVREDEPSASVLAFAQELERLMLMSGRRIASDRHDPPVSAKQLFDRMVVLEQRMQDVQQASIPAAELIWDMLAYDKVFRELPDIKRLGEEVFCCGAVADGYALPAESLWKWVRERTLARGINGQHLGLIEKHGRFAHPKLSSADIKTDVEEFWMARNSTRPASLFLIHSRAILRSANPDSASALISLQDQLPLDKPYHEQAAYSDGERQGFGYYLEEWCYNILEREQRKGNWGLHSLMAALLRIESDFKTILTRVNRNSGRSNLANLATFASSLHAEFLNIISGLRVDLSNWIASLTGPQLELNIGPHPTGRLPLCYDIEAMRIISEEGLGTWSDEATQRLDGWFEEWYRTYGSKLLERLHFLVKLEANDHRLRIRLRMDNNREAKSDEDVGSLIRATLDDYQNIVWNWPSYQLIRTESVSNPVDRFRVGKYSANVYPRVERALDEDDPFTIAALEWRERPLKEALGVARPVRGEMPYAWPEEANAARIAEKIRNRLSRDPQPFSSIVVHLLRDTRKLFELMSDLAEGRVESFGTSFMLKREAKQYAIGPMPENLSGLEAFQSIVQQVVSFEVSLKGEPIVASSTSWIVDPEEAVRAVEKHPLAREAMSSPAWVMWQDVIRGLALEHGSR